MGLDHSPQFSRAGNLPAKANVIAGYGRNVSNNSTLAKTVLTLLNFLWNIRVTYLLLGIITTIFHQPKELTPQQWRARK